MGTKRQTSPKSHYRAAMKGRALPPPPESRRELHVARRRRRTFTRWSIAGLVVVVLWHLAVILAAARGIR